MCDPEEPRPEGRPLVAEAIDGAERSEERPLGGVLGVVVVPEQVEAVAVHAVQVAPVEGREGGVIRLRGSDVGEIRVHPPRLVGGRAVDAHAGAPLRTRTISPLVSSTRPPAVSSTSAPRSSIPMARPSTRPVAVSTATSVPSVVQTSR